MIATAHAPAVGIVLLFLAPLLLHRLAVEVPGAVVERVLEALLALALVGALLELLARQPLALKQSNTLASAFFEKQHMSRNVTVMENATVEAIYKLLSFYKILEAHFITPTMIIMNSIRCLISQQKSHTLQR